jgi:hypothetical protein
VNDFQDRVTGAAGTPGWVSVRGSTRELPAGMVSDIPKVSLPVADLRSMAAAALKVEWPERYSGKDGVTKLAR